MKILAGLKLYGKNPRQPPARAAVINATSISPARMAIKNNEKVAIFPEGTRNKTDAEMLEFKHGASIMAIRTKTPIVPVVLYERPRFFHKAHILIGEPFEFSEYYDKKLTDEDYAEADNKLRTLMLNMRKEHAEFLMQEKERKKNKKKGNA